MKNESPKIKTYKRADESLVDLDKFLTTANDRIPNLIAYSDIKDKYKDDVLKTVNLMLNMIRDNPSSLRARIGGGFTNTTGLTNRKEGFDDVGVAAGFIGKVLREMESYKETESNDSSLKTYDPNGKVITPELQRSALGDDPEAFARLDYGSYDKASKTMKLDRRNEHLKNWLINYRKEIEEGKHWKYNEETDKQQLLKKIDDSLNVLSNNDPNDDWFSLSQLGFTDIGKYFYTGTYQKIEDSSDSSDSSETQSNELETNEDFNLFKSYVDLEFPTPTGPLRLYSLQYNKIPNAQSLSKLKSGFNLLTDKDLKTWLKSIITYYDKYDAANNEYIRQVNPSGYFLGLEKEFLVTEILLKLFDKGNILKLVLGNIYFIPFLTSKSKGTGWVWDMDTNSIHELSVHDIPYMQLYIVNSFAKQYPNRVPLNSTSKELFDRYKLYKIYKKGGILKAKKGDKFLTRDEAVTYRDEDLTDDKRIRNIYNNGLLTFDTRGDVVALEGNDPNKIKYKIEPGGALVEANPYYKTWIKLLTTNDKLAEAWARRYRSLLPISDVHYKSWFNEDDTFNKDNFIKALTSNNHRVYDDGFNGIGHDFYRGRVYRIVNDNGEYEEGYYDDVLDGYELVGDPELDSDGLVYTYKMRKKIDNSDPATTTNSEIDNSTDLDKEEPDEYDIDEIISRMKDLNNFKNSNYEYTWNPDLLGIKRLVNTLDSYPRIRRVLDPSLIANLHETYELLHPEYGKYGTRQLLNNLANDILFQALRPFTSDPYLMEAAELEGLIEANNLRYKANIIDDEEYKRTKKENLKRVEDNIARRSNTDNENRDMIYKSKLQRAQLKASEILQRVASLDNYDKDIETKLYTRNEEIKDLLTNTRVSDVNSYKSNAMQQIYNVYRRSDPEGEMSYTDWIMKHYDTYKQAVEKINEVTTALKKKAILESNGLPYNWPMSTNRYGDPTPLDFNIDDYIWTNKRGGKLIPRIKIYKK